MGFFDSSKTKETLEYLEAERKKLWQRVTDTEELIKKLEKEIEARTPEAERTAKGHSKKAAEFRNKTEERLKEAEVFLLSLQAELNEANELKQKISELLNEAEGDRSIINNSKTALDERTEEIVKSFDQLQTRISKVDEIYAKYPNIEVKINEVDGFIESIESNKDKATQALKNINTTRQEIQNLHREIFGYVDTNDEDEDVTIEGKKDQLENAYKELEENIEKSVVRISELTTESEKKFEKFNDSHQKKYDDIIKEINSLLPGAMTAGLSTAFAEKKNTEIETAKELKASFQKGIIGLVLASSLPIIISGILYFNSYDFDTIVLDFLPRLVFTFIPLYIPILWFAYSANKKYNLSKRLIEEYSHKEVLSKTYQGLANQINGLNDEYQSEELKLKLLNNFLQITSENPGKLISNYQVSDHPIMEALDQAYKYEAAVDKLEGIPGMGIIRVMLSKKANKHKDEARKLAEGDTGLDNESEENEA